MKLRQWQEEAVAAALKKFETPYSHFLCLATPGAGKTVMASVLADIMLKEHKVDLVLCFSPSTVVADDFKVELEAITNKRFCGGLGAVGQSVTYQSMRHIENSVWRLLKTHRVLVIFDEIHHCAGHESSRTNSWGEGILRNVQGAALYTIALTGTPWRSDTIPITLAEYVGDDNKICVDYSYNLTQAIREGVCRAPHMTSLDNECITVASQGKSDSFSSIEALLKDGCFSYMALIQHDEVIKQLIKRGINRLNNERKMYPDAGGLIVASSITHARQIQGIMSELGEESIIVSYQEDSPEYRIKRFKHSKDKWIISISMISEGTNIPRLRVCCYLSLVTTELYFRQVIGRVLRTHYSGNERGYFIMPAHPRLVEFAKRMKEEIPHYAVLDKPIEGDIGVKKPRSEPQKNKTKQSNKPKPGLVIGSDIDINAPSPTPPLHTLKVMSLQSFGRFRQQIYAL